jgi:hypothetical protein
MAWNRHAIAQTQSLERRRVDGAGRLKFDFHTDHHDSGMCKPLSQITFGSPWAIQRSYCVYLCGNQPVCLVHR